MQGKRIDKILTDRNFAQSKSQAQAMILAGHVKVNGEKIIKSSQTLPAKEFLMINLVAFHISTTYMLARIMCLSGP